MRCIVFCFQAREPEKIERESVSWKRKIVRDNELTTNVKLSPSSHFLLCLFNWIQLPPFPNQNQVFVQPDLRLYRILAVANRRQGTKRNSVEDLHPNKIKRSMKSISQMRKTRTITRSRFPELLKCDELTTSPYSNCHLHSRFILDDGSQIGWQNGGLLRSGERGKNSSVCLLNQVGSAVAGRRVKSQSSRLNTIMQEGGTVLSR